VADVVVSALATLDGASTAFLTGAAPRNAVDVFPSEATVPERGAVAQVVLLALPLLASMLLLLLLCRQVCPELSPASASSMTLILERLSFGSLVAGAVTAVRGSSRFFDVVVVVAVSPLGVEHIFVRINRGSGWTKPWKTRS
jgi:hypothetical protein